MVRTRFALILYFRMVAHKAACHTLSKAFLKSMKTWYRFCWCWRYFSHRILRLKICSVVLLPALNPACSSAIISSACSELYNYESCGDNAVLDCSQPPEEDLQPILREEVEIAVASLKKGKAAGVDNIPAELVQAGGETMIDVLTEICNRIWRTGEWPTPWTQSLIITLPKKGNLQLCQNYRTISLISHSSKVMLKVILNRLNVLWRL